MKTLLKISRPRFWIYLAGPYLVGLAAGFESASDLLRLDVIVFGIYFLLPANLLVYGINDIFDYESDRKNPKKAGYEVLVTPDRYPSLWLWIAVLNLPFVIAGVALAHSAMIPFAVFLFLAIFYSAPPIRAKQVPILDSIFNVLYILPGVFAYQMLTGALPGLNVIAAGALWTAAMHAFSAIPDIESDRVAGVSTIATALGPTGTHLFCIACYLGSAALAFTPALSTLGAVYVLMMLMSLVTKEVFAVYRWFPAVNALTGTFLFFYAAWPKL